MRKIVLMLLFSALMVTSVHAASNTFLAPVDILKPIVIAQGDGGPMNFGRVQSASSGNTVFTVINSVLAISSGGGAIVSATAANSGDFFIVASSTTSFTATAVPGPNPCTVTGASLTGTTPVPGTGTGPFDIRIDGELTVGPNAEGIGVCEYTVTANYN